MYVLIAIVVLIGLCLGFVFAQAFIQGFCEGWRRTRWRHLRGAWRPCERENPRQNL